MGLPANLRFSNSNSFRLFTEGLQALQAFERSAKPEVLKIAAGKFEECVSDYHHDLLPRLYLGIVRTHEGETLNEAISLLQDVVAEKIPQVTAAARYYLAEAFVARYAPDDFDRADKLLSQVIEDAQANPLDRLRARALQSFIYVRQRLWENRQLPKESPEQRREADEAAKRLDYFWIEIERSGITKDLRDSLIADYWNYQGLFDEYKANKAEPSERSDLIQRSLEAYEKAAGFGANRADALGNQARVYFELKQDFSKAIKLCQEVLTLRDGDSFAHLLLGKIYQDQKEFDDAIEHYSAAMSKFAGESAFRTAQCYELMQNCDAAIEMYKRVPEKSSFFSGAQDALDRLQPKKSTLLT